MPQMLFYKHIKVLEYCSLFPDRSDTYSYLSGNHTDFTLIKS